MGITLNYSTLNKQAKIGYNALYNVIFAHVASMNDVNRTTEFTVPLCLNSDNKVSLASRHFIYFKTILNELNVAGYYAIVKNKGRAVDDVKTDFSTVKVVLSRDNIVVPADIKQFDFADVDVTKLQQRNGKQEKQKTEANKTAEANKAAEAEATAEALEAKTAEAEALKKEVAKKEEQLNKKAIDEFNDDALLSIANCIEVLVKKHCPIPSEFDFTKFECDLFKVIESKWDLKSIEK